MSDDLVRKVETAMYEADGYYVNIHQARAVIAMVLEEAAIVCDRRYMGDNNREDMEARRCAAEICKIKENNDAA